MQTARNYPDISQILARKAKGRQAMAALSFAEKLAVLDTLKQASADMPRRPGASLDRRS